MGRIIKGRAAESGDIAPDTGFSDAASSSRQIVKGDKYAAKAEAQGIRERAELEARYMLEQAAQEAEQVKKKAYDEAHALGYNEGKSEAAQKLMQVVATTSARLDQIEKQAVPQLKELALKIARKILGRELEFHPDAVIDIVKQALSEKARLRREVFLRVHPDDLQLVRDHKPELIEVLSRCKEIGIREDPDVGRHGVIIETDAGVIDAQLETQLAVFERIFKDMM